MAINTAFGFILLSISLLCVDPKKGFMNLLTSETQSGHFARGMSLAILTVPPALGFITHLATLTGFINVTLQVSIFMLLLITFWFIITWRLTRHGEEREIEILFLTEKLKISEEKVKLVLEKASDGIFTADMNGNYIDVNEFGCRMFGYKREEIIGRNIRHFLPKSEYYKLDQKMHQIKHDGATQLTEWTMLKKNGETLSVEISDTLLKDGRWVGIVRDIEDRVRANKAMENSERKFRGLLEAAQDAVVIVNSNGMIDFMNGQALNWFGYKGQELKGQSIETLIPERYRLRHVSQRNGYLSNPIARPMGRDLELFGRRKDGSEFPVDVALSPSETADGMIVTAVIRDITDIKKREREINFLADLGNKLSESLDDCKILSIAAELVVPGLADCCMIRSQDERGNFRTQKIVHRNPAFLEKMEAYSRTVEAAPETQRTLNEMIMKGESFISVGGIKSAVYVHPEVQKHLDELHIHSYIVVPLKPKSTVVGTMSFILDDPHRSFELSDIRFFENVAHRICLSLENAKLYKDAKQAIKIREDVLSIVSHDLKNPLSYITLKTQLLHKDKDAFDEKLSKFTSSIAKATGQMQTLIDDLLDFAKLESGTLKIDCENHNVHAILSPLIDIVTTHATEKNISLDFKVDSSVTSVFCDSDRIRQVLSNLLGNAIKFTQPGGHISLLINQEDNHVHFCVEDNGPGISPDYLEKIFDRFWQSDETKKKGSGLGLSICKSIVLAHNGKIWAESEEGRGSKFHFVLPSPYISG